jgi:ABC-type antimicrobial peptide transport system permease subunit
MKDKDRIWSLIAKRLAGEASAAELSELEELLKKYPDTTYPMELLTDLWKQQQATDTSETDRAFAKHLQRMAEQDEPAPATDEHSSQQPRTHFTWTNRGNKKERLLSFLTANGMLGGYCKLAWRNLRRSRVFSIINITGLAIGMAGALLILLWLRNELSYDQFHTKKDRIYKVYNSVVFNGKIETWGSTPMVMAPVLKQYPEVENITRVNWVAAFILKTNDKQLQPQGYLSDPGFLTMFDFPLMKGNAATALNAPHSIVITEQLSQKLFGHTDALGKVIRIDSNALFTVTGVMKDLPNNTQFKFEYLVPWSYMKEVGWENNNWAVSANVQTYVLLKPGITEQLANFHFRDIIKTNDKKLSNAVFLHPMRKWHLWSRFENGQLTGGDIEGVRLMSIIAAFILLIACINYMNLSTARSVKRAREVGIRKVAGAGKGTLIGQFLGESILIAFIAGLFSLAIATYALPWFNQLTFKKLFIPFSDLYFWLAGIAFILFTGILAGSYPAFYLSSFHPVAVLKGSFKAVHAFITPRKVLVVVQFSFAIVLIICTLVVYRQIAFGKKRDAGYNMDQLVFVYNLGDLSKNYRLIRDELIRSGAVTSMVRTGSPVTEIWSSEEDFNWKGKDPGNKSMFITFYTEKDFAKTLGLKIIAGRDINAEVYPTDSTAVLLNESAVKVMGLKDPIGQTITNSKGTLHVVGVVNNFVPGLPWEPVYPMAIEGPGIKGWFGTLTFRLNSQYNQSKSIAAIQSVLKKYNPDYPFDYYFVHDMYAGKFQDVINTGMLAATSAGLTIFISCLGLFALAAYMAENRIKEIGIRKVLGASITAITTLLSKDFLKLVLIAFVIASPVAWWMMHNWLQDFSYRISISWWIFAVTGSVSMGIALLTVSYQAIKAALANPARSLRSE